MRGTITTARVETLALWLESRLATRPAITWVTKAFNGEKGLSNDDLIALLSRLAVQAQRQADLAPETTKIWRLLHRASHDRVSRFSSHHSEHFRRAIREGTFRVDDVKTLVDFVRPRLWPSEPSRFVVAEEGFANDPRRWVIWSFKTASQDVGQGIGRISRERLSRLPSDVLAQLLIESTSTLEATLELAIEAGWIKGSYDLANSYVTQVAFDARKGALPATDEDDNDRDPDTYHDGFAPLARLITTAFSSLTEIDTNAVHKIVALWDGHDAALFIRLRAHVGLTSSFWDGHQVGQFLAELPDLPFWRWSAFPEVASLRATRWRDVPAELCGSIADRLAKGPSAANLALDTDVSEETLSYWQDHEIARIVDNNADVPGKLVDIVQSRRARDREFPAYVPAMELGTPTMRYTRVPDGDPEAFAHVPDRDLVTVLAKSKMSRAIGAGNDAEAYARKNRRKVVDLLAQSNNRDEGITDVWELALAYPHDKPDDIEDARKTAEQIAKQALEMDKDLFESLADRFCYWLDATDEQLKDFSGAVSLWQSLLPYAVRRENSQVGRADGLEADLSSAALNVPLGHLISFFFRRCPTMPARGDRPPLPTPFVSALKALKGRAKALLANRMAISMNYFWLADRTWLTEFVLDAMLLDKPEGAALWEAFAKFAPVPNPALWHTLEEALFKHLAGGRLSKDSLRRMAEMAIVVWTWTKAGDSSYDLNASELRSALGMSSEEVRGAAAWQFRQLLYRDDQTTEARTNEEQEKLESKWRWSDLGPSFFSEVWPMEPAAQSPQSAKDFARIPSLAGIQHYSDAIRTIIPFLRPFEIWDVDTTLGLKKEANQIICRHPTETLALIAACVPEQQMHPIYGLGRVLSLIAQANAEAERDPEFRRLRRLAANDE